MRFCTQCGASLEAAAMTPVAAVPDVRPSHAPPPGYERYNRPAEGSPIASAVAVAGPAHSDPRSAPPAQPVGIQEHAGLRLVSILKDGSDGPVFPLMGDQIDIGRTEGDVILGDDPYLSPRHARLRRKGDAVYVRDLDSANGVYFRIREPMELADGDRILIGQQVLRFELLEDIEAPLGPASLHGVLVFGTPAVPRVARLVQYTTEGVGRDVHYLYRGETILGRENGDIVFTDDPFLSRRHASIKLERATRRFVLTDMGSSNGTALRIHGERGLAPGDQFRVGRHLFRLDLEGTPMMARTAR
jgi:pSer/pThr/pTyr-binding forkhead associated (FHA) protein